MSASLPLKIVVLISGNGSNLQSIIDHISLGKLNAAITAVVSNKVDAAGLQKARDQGIPAITVPESKGEPRENYDQRLADIINRYNPDLVVCAGFMRIFSNAFVAQYQGRIINIHPSLLPKYRGLHTHRRVLESGDPIHGVSVHFVTPELDGGPVIMQTTVPVLDGDNEQSLAKRVLEEEHKLYPLAIQYYADQRIQLADNKVLLDNHEVQQPLQIPTT